MERTAAQRVSEGAGHFRFLFMPVGLLALVAVGVHAGADLVDDRLLRLLEALDARLDSLFAQAAWTRGWVDAVGSLERTVAARGLALAWELAVDVLVALPLLGYREAEAAPLISAVRAREAAGQVLLRTLRAPTPLRVLRPLAVACFVAGGAVQVSRLVEGSLFVGLGGGLLPEGWAGPAARGAAVAAAALVLVSLGARAVGRALEHGDRASSAAVAEGRSAWTAGLWGTALAVPLGVALALEGRALLGIFQ